jgi:hypothetical protein
MGDDDHDQHDNNDASDFDDRHDSDGLLGAMRVDVARRGESRWKRVVWLVGAGGQ